jgi:PAS domain S-box-containing protein
MLNVMEDLEKAKMTIETEKAKDEAMLACIGEGLIAVDNKTNIIVVNNAAEKMIRWNRKDMLGKEITSLPLEDEEGNPIPIEKRPTYMALSTGKTINGNYFFARKNKTKFPIAITTTPIKLNQKIIGTIIIFRDITREQEIDRAKSEFVSLASHQLRTPLGIVKWYIEALKNEECFIKAPRKIKKYINEIEKSNERVLSLVRDLLSVSRIEQKQFKTSPQFVNITHIVKEIREQMNILAHKKKLHLHLTISTQKIPLINIDPLQFHEVLENLIANAIFYTLSPGSVKVIVTKTEKNVMIQVKDTGIGISATDQKKLFTKFFRSEKAILHNPEGSGLGLYVVKSYVENWGGKIFFTSLEGKGSTFTINLPFFFKQKPMEGGVTNEKNTDRRR